MNPTEFSNCFDVRLVHHQDLPTVLSLYQTNPLYFEHFPPMPSLSSVEKDWITYPPTKSKDDKYFVGFWDNNQLVAVLDLIKGYPDEATVFIGLFMVDGRLSGRGIGTQIINELLAYLYSRFQKVRLAYVESNSQARYFWKKVGFTPTAVTKEKNNQNIVISEYHFCD